MIYGVLECNIIKCTNIAGSIISKPDIYVKIYLKDLINNAIKTKVIKNDNNPVFNHK